MNAPDCAVVSTGLAPTLFTRPRFHRFLVATLGTALGISHGRETRAAQCRKKSDRCHNSNQCCSKRCRRGFCYPQWR